MDTELDETHNGNCCNCSQLLLVGMDSYGFNLAPAAKVPCQVSSKQLYCKIFRHYFFMDERPSFKNPIP